MSAGILIFDIFAAFLVAAVILYRYGDWYRHHIIVTLAVLVAWCFSFLIIFVLPLDVSSAVYRQCQQRFNVSLGTRDVPDGNGTAPSSPCQPPWSNIPYDTFHSLWRIVYWSSQFLTWIIMPLMQSYTQAGDFTITGKLRSAAIDNAIYYGSYLLIAGILLIYIATKPGETLDWQRLKAIASSSSNTWGLFLLVLLLGHALVEIPRNLWNNSKPGYALQYSYFKVTKVSRDKADAEDEVLVLLESLQNVVNIVKPQNVLHKHVLTILEKLPLELGKTINTEQSGSGSGNFPTEKSLIQLHRALKKALQKRYRTQAQWNIIVEQSIFLEDIDRNMLSHRRRFKPTFPPQRNTFVNIVFNPTIEWYYRCFLHRWILRFLAVITGVLSVAVVWSEVSFFREKPVLSLFAVLLDVSIRQYDYYTMELVSTAVIGYLCYCAYSTVLQIKLLNKYYIAPNHQTDEFSLIFSGMMLSRLTPPMCLNFLGMIHMDSHIIKTPFLETAYTQIMGHMDVISIISDGFNIYFPMLMVLFCLASYFSLASRLMASSGIPQFIGDEFTTDFVDEGKQLILSEKKRKQRQEESEMRRREFQNLRDGGNSRGSDRQQRERDQRGDYFDDPARAGLLEGAEDLDYYVQPPAQNDFTAHPFSDSNRDRVGRLPKGFFDDV